MLLIRRIRLLPFLIVLGLVHSSCVTSSASEWSHSGAVEGNAPSADSAFRTARGGAVPSNQYGKNTGDDALLGQGFVGLAWMNEVERTDSDGAGIDGASDDLAWLPVLGGGLQRRTGEGENFYWGYEVLGSASWTGGADLQRNGPGSESSNVSVDLFVLDLYGGPFVGFEFAELWHAYGSFGPLIEYAQWDQVSGPEEEIAKGFGLGVYARIGVDYSGWSDSRMGLALRWSKTNVDLGSADGDVDLSGLRLVFTLLRSM
jgi:hypothetical protein